MFRVAAWLIFFLITGTIVAFCEDDRFKLRKFVENSKKAYSLITDYEALFYQKERIDGRLYGNEGTHLIFVRPFAIYMRFNGGNKDGVEIFFEPGRFNNRIRARRPGLLGFMNLYVDPRGRLATANSNRTIHEVGVLNLIDLIDNDLDRAIENGHGLFTHIGEVEIDGRLADRFDVEFSEVGYAGEVIRLYFDCLTKLPFKVIILDRGGELQQMYYLKNLKINQGHTVASIGWD